MCYIVSKTDMYAHAFPSIQVKHLSENDFWQHFEAAKETDPVPWRGDAGENGELIC